MAVQNIAQPATYQLAYNDNVYVFGTSQPTATKRFRLIVFDSSLNSLATLVVYPVATPGSGTTPNRAYTDVSRIVQSAIGSDITIAPASHNAFYRNPNSHIEYRVVVQEEDINPATGAYQTLSNWLFYDQRSVWNGVQDLADWIDFNPTDYLMTTGAPTSKFLSDGPSTREIKSEQSAYLYLIASEDNAPTRYQLITYDDYNGTGSVINNTTVSNPYATDLTNSFNFRYLRMPIGTYDISRTDAALFSSGSPATILNGAKSYTIRLQDNIGVGQVISETITFNVDQECSKFDGVRLHWLGRLGGFESFNFNFKSIEREDIKRKDYRQQHHTWTGSAWEYDKMSRGRTQYDTQTNKKVKVNTGYLTDAESVWMESLFSSPTIYEERSNELIAVNIDGSSITKQTSLNNKLCQYSFDLEYSLLNYRQRG
jgi:hypothetical protein